MSDITLINDSEQSSLVTNGLAKNGEMYLKKAGSTDAGSIVVYDSGSWKTFANEYSSGFANTYSVDFDGTNDHMSTSSSSDFAFGTGGFSIGLWFYSNGTSNTNIFDFRSSGGSLYVPSLWLRTNGGSSHIRYYVQGSGGYLVNAYPTLNTGNWYHVLIAGNGTTTSIYLNGNSTALASASDTTNYQAAPLTLGKYFGNNTYTWNGLIDEFAVWNACLDGDDANAIYNSGTPNDLTNAASYNTNRTSNLVGYWRMGDGTEAGSGTTVYDMSGNSNDGTLVNGPTFSTDVPS